MLKTFAYAHFYANFSEFAYLLWKKHKIKKIGIKIRIRKKFLTWAKNSLLTGIEPATFFVKVRRPTNRPQGQFCVLPQKLCNFSYTYSFNQTVINGLFNNGNNFCIGEFSETYSPRNPDRKRSCKSGWFKTHNPKLWLKLIPPPNDNMSSAINPLHTELPYWTLNSWLRFWNVDELLKEIFFF